MVNQKNAFSNFKLLFSIDLLLFFYEIRICFRFYQFDYLTAINNMFPVQLNVSRMSESKEETLKAEIPGINKVQQKFKYNESNHCK